MSLVFVGLSLGPAASAPQSGPPGASQRAGLHLGCHRSRALFSFESPRHPTNNVAERTIRHAVSMRKSSFGTDNGEGSRYVERMLTTMASLRLQNRNILKLPTASVAAHRGGERGPNLVLYAQGATEQKAA